MFDQQSIKVILEAAKKEHDMEADTGLMHTQNITY